MNGQISRIAVNVGGGYVPGINAAIAGTVLAASELGWDVVGIRDGFDGLLTPERRPHDGIVPLSSHMVDERTDGGSSLLGTAPRSDPFRVRTLTAGHQIEEVDRSAELLATLRSEGIDAVVSIVGRRALGIAWKLSRNGLRTVCVPTSVANDVAATSLSLGFNSALSFVAEILERAHHAARAARRLAIVEVPGEHSGWLALQAGIAVDADAVLIPEIPYDLRSVGAKLREKIKSGKRFGLVVVAEGARPKPGTAAPRAVANPALKAALSPGADDVEGSHVIEGSGKLAEALAVEFQRLTDEETSPLVLGDWAKGGASTVIDRQLGLGYGAGAVSALRDGESGVMVVFQPPDLKFVPIKDSMNEVRTVPTESGFVRIARSLGISLGD